MNTSIANPALNGGVRTVCCADAVGEVLSLEVTVAGNTYAGALVFDADGEEQWEGGVDGKAPPVRAVTLRCRRAGWELRLDDHAALEPTIEETAPLFLEFVTLLRNSDGVSEELVITVTE